MLKMKSLIFKTPNDKIKTNKINFQPIIWTKMSQLTDNKSKVVFKSSALSWDLMLCRDTSDNLKKSTSIRTKMKIR